MANPLTVAQYTARIEHAIGNESPATGFSTLEILNEALRALFGYADWSWRLRSPALLSLVASQEYVALPSDFGTSGELLSIHSVWSPVSVVSKVSLADIATMRGMPLNNTFQYYVALSNPTQTSASVRPGTPRLEIWPTPGSNVSNAFRITYKSGPVDLSLTTDVPNIPREYENVLTLLARAYAMRYEYGSDAQETLAELASAEKEIRRLMEMDGMIESEAGPLTGGAAANYLPTRGNYPFRPFSTYTPR